ncbi:MAG: GPP34 family phosphoprotein, partial [Herbiconiux sp.]|nr:GPP34 family phosphoprotein [Herbiconiux sp.]
ELRERLRTVLVKGAEPDLRTGLLISLLSPLDLVKSVVHKPDRKEAKQRAKTIAESDLGGAATSKAVKQAVDAITAAIVMGAIVPAVVATSS